MLSKWEVVHEETQPINGPISFPSVNPNRFIVPRYDALVLTLCISGFDVVLVLAIGQTCCNYLPSTR